MPSIQITILAAATPHTSIVRGVDAKRARMRQHSRHARKRTHSTQTESMCANRVRVVLAVGRSPCAALYSDARCTGHPANDSGRFAHIDRLSSLTPRLKGADAPALVSVRLPYTDAQPQPSAGICSCLGGGSSNRTTLRPCVAPINTPAPRGGRGLFGNCDVAHTALWCGARHCYLTRRGDLVGCV